MKLPISWLAEWLGELPDADVIAERLTMLGHEVDGVSRLGDGLQPFVVAKIQRVESHPNADRLRVCQVTLGDGDPLQIVCGAPNATEGLVTVLAPVGTKMPDGNKIRRSKLRGVESAGMLCSAVELGLGDDHDGIMDLPESLVPGTPVMEALGLPDAVLDLDLTPNRGDCFSVLGIARELGVILDRSLGGPTLSAAAASVEDRYSVGVSATEACPRFASRVIVDVDNAKASPMWLTARLTRAGLRPISPVVDITNYVMLELGQPLHAYDLDKLSGPIDVRLARAGEALTLLDEKTLELDDDVVVIADDSGAIGMAGVMGGLSTSVSPETTRVLFEGAFWTPSWIRGRARRFGMHTDASLRFERGVDPNEQGRAVDRAAQLLTEIAGGQSGPLEVVVSDAFLPARSAIELDYEHVERVLGTQVPEAQIQTILARLGLDVTPRDGGLTATAPGHRFDLEIAEDLIEEIARIVGYDTLPAKTATAQLALSAATESLTPVGSLRSALVAAGFTEVVTYSFVDPQWQDQVCGEGVDLRLANPLSNELSVMRRSLLPGLLKTVAANRARQHKRAQVFEIGNCFVHADAAPEVMRVAGLIWGSVAPEQWGDSARDADFYDMRRIVDLLFGKRAQALQLTAHPIPGLHPGQAAEIALDNAVVGMLGTVHPSLCRLTDLAPAPIYFELALDAVVSTTLPKFTPVSRFPASRRDLALLVAEETAAGALLDAVRTHCGSQLQDVILFDKYQGKGIEPGLKSIALGLILQETSRTLTDEEADEAVRSVALMLKENFGAVLRDR